MASVPQATTGLEAPSDKFSMFQPVSSSRISATIAEQIRSLIHRGELSAGDRLPSERELCTTFEVSRVSIRDALRVLESAGLIEIRVGARGGAFVTAPTSSNISASLSDMLAMSSLSASEVTETRMIFELGVIELVCQRATEGDLAILKEICDRSQEALDQGQYTMDLSAEFHVALVGCAHNRSIDLLVDSFQKPLRMSLLEAQHSAPNMGDPGVREHYEILAAIRENDPIMAKAILNKHLNRTASRLSF